jgi:hypothetical protein
MFESESLFWQNSGGLTRRKKKARQNKIRVKKKFLLKRKK